MLAEQSFCPSRYQLESFTESSFTSSWLYLDTSNSQSPLSKRKEEVSDSDEEGKLKDDFVKEGNNHLREASLKRAKPSLALLEMFQEQLKTVKRKVCSAIVEGQMYQPSGGRWGRGWGSTCILRQFMNSCQETS